MFNYFTSRQAKKIIARMFPRRNSSLKCDSRVSLYFQPQYSFVFVLVGD